MAWINRTNDIEHVLVLCESVDERVGLRLAVLRNQDEWRTRNQLRALDSQIVQMIASLGLNPSDRKMLSVEQPVAGKLAELRALRSS
ncbi:MAG: hypothetical protein KBC93_16160 [Candidatus Microthrix sp.]|jgi:hypothetical protein|nr:hypothetical protein [Candidatus Microthrix sp.]